MKRLLLLSPTTDIGGGAIALKRAFERYAPDWTVHAVRRRNNVFDYPADIVWTRGDEMVRRRVAELFERADVVHIWEIPGIVRELGVSPRGKTIVVSHVGSRFRDDPRAVSDACAAIGAFEAVGSHELMQYATRGELIIGPCAFETVIQYRAEYRPSERVRIVTAPTDRIGKSTAAFLTATERLATRYPIDVDVIEDVSWAECLRRKAQADIFFDQVLHGYGGNAIEAWAMGIPVVAGMQEDPGPLAEMEAEWGIPFVNATETTIAEALEPLIVDPVLRVEWGQRGYWFADRVHSERVTVDRMLGVYERARKLAT